MSNFNVCIKPMYKQSYTLQVGMYYQNWADELTLFKPRGADYARHTITKPPPRI